MAEVDNDAKIYSKLCVLVEATLNTMHFRESFD